MHREAGFSLLETMIASSLLALALLPLAAAAARSLQDAATTHDHFLAIHLLRDLEGRVTLSGGLDAWTTPLPSGEQERTQWTEQVHGALPSSEITWCRASATAQSIHGDAECVRQGPMIVDIHFQPPLAGDRQSQWTALSP